MPVSDAIADASQMRGEAFFFAQDFCSSSREAACLAAGTKRRPHFSL
jgi:hypothetical protein